MYIALDSPVSMRLFDTLSSMIALFLILDFTRALMTLRKWEL